MTLTVTRTDPRAAPIIGLHPPHHLIETGGTVAACGLEAGAELVPGCSTPEWDGRAVCDVCNAPVCAVCIAVATRRHHHAQHPHRKDAG